MRQRKVSVIVPAYNVEPYIEQCINSIRQQTYRNLEILIVDDGSADGTLKVLKELEMKDLRIAVIRQQNQGVSSARNAALAKASGDYCCFVDGDDWIEPNMVETLVRALEETDSDWVNCQYFRKAQDGKELERYHFIEEVCEMDTVIDKMNFLFHKLLIYKVGYEVWDKIYKMSIIRENGLCFCRECKMGEDLGFNLCYAVKAKRINCIKKRLYHYRIRDNSAMAKAGDKQYNLLQYVAFTEFVYQEWKRIQAEGTLQLLYFVCFSRIMDNAERGLCDKEIAEIVRKMQYKDFYTKQINLMADNKQILCNWYGQEGGMVVWKHSLCIQRELGEISGKNKMYLGMLETYRSLKGRNRIEFEPHA